MKIELILEEKKKKSNIGTNGNGSTPVLVNQINENQDDIEAIKQAGYKGQNFNSNYQPNRNHNESNGPAKCAHCKKPGHTVEKCFTKFPQLRPQNNQRQNNSNEGANAGKKNCKFCDKEGHTADKCFILERAEKKVNSAKSRVNEVHEGHEKADKSNISKN